MEATNFKHLLTSHAPITLTEVNELTTLLDKFPYLQSARSLQLKGLKTNFDTQYNQILKITAAYTTDRSVLFNYITSHEFVTFISKENRINKQLEINNPTIETSIIIDEKTSTKEHAPLSKIKDALEIGKPLTFNVDDSFSFNEWLQLTAVNPIERDINDVSYSTSESQADNNLHSNLIDTFINSKPKIAPPDKNSPIIDVSEKSLERNDSLMTETLARVYLEQKKYKNAIKAYKILSLKYPEKSGYFADQIKAISILQNNI